MKFTSKECIYAKTILAMDESAKSYNKVKEKISTEVLELVDDAIDKAVAFDRLYQLSNKGSTRGQTE